MPEIRRRMVCPLLEEREDDDLADTLMAISIITKQLALLIRDAAEDDEEGE